MNLSTPCLAIISSSTKEAVPGPGPRGLSHLVLPSEGSFHRGHCWWVRAWVSNPYAFQL